MRVEVSDFRNLLLCIGAQLKDSALITDAEHADFMRVYNTTVRGDIFGKSAVCRVYKNAFAVANSKEERDE